MAPRRWIRPFLTSDSDSACKTVYIATWECALAKKIIVVKLLVFRKCWFLNILVFPRFDLENFGLERSGRSVGFISTNSHTYKSSWCRVMPKKTKNGFLKILVFLQFSEVSDCRFGFLVKNCIYSHLGSSKFNSR